MNFRALGLAAVVVPLSLGACSKPASPLDRLAGPPSGLVTLQYDNAGHRRDFELRPTTRKEWVFKREAIRDADTALQASPAQQAELRDTLQATRAAMSQDDDCRYEVGLFLMALNAPKS